MEYSTGLLGAQPVELMVGPAALKELTSILPSHSSRNCRCRSGSGNKGC
jgi:hypothetical protein